jgi:uncharacterized protein (TIRG00374 family)
MNRKRIIDLLKIVVTLGMAYWVFRAVEVEHLWDVLVNADWGWLLITLVLAFMGVVVRAKRWQILLDVFELDIPLLELVRMYFIGFFFNNLLPSGLGGDAVRMLELNKRTHRGSDTVTSVVVDRLMGLFGSVTLASLALIFSWRTVPIEIAVASVLVFLGIIFGGFVLLNKSLYNLLRRIGLIRKITDIKFVNGIFTSFQTYNLKAIGRSFLAGIVLSLILIGMNVTIGLALGIDTSLAYYLVFVPLISLVLLLPITFAGLGTREAAYVFLFTQVGVSTEAALGLSLLYYSFGNIAPVLVGGIIYLWQTLREWRDRQQDPQPQVDSIRESRL